MNNIKQQIATLEQQLATLKQNVQELAEKKKQEVSNTLETSLLKKPVPGRGDSYWMLEGHSTRKLSVHVGGAYSEEAVCYQHGSIFQSESLAQAYAEAIETMLLLRHQPGTVKPQFDRDLYFIDPTEDGEGVEVDFGCTFQLMHISPCFRTKELAQQATEAVGKERILKMFRTFHGLEGY